jgi:hypothetical protein
VEVDDGAYDLEGPGVGGPSSERSPSSCYTTVAHPVQLERFDSEGKSVWRVPIVSDDSHAGALAADWKGAYVATMDPFGTCTLVRAFGADGRSLWERSLGCLGQARHSYENDVTLTIDEDRLLVYGAESAGQYVAGLDLQTGKSLCERRFNIPKTP